MKNEADRIQTFIKATFAKAGKTTAIIGLSGGIDSAVSLTLTVHALGPNNVRAFHLPAKNSNPIHENDAKIAAESVGLPEQNFQVIPIGSIMQKTWRIIKKHLPEPSDIGPNTTNRNKLTNELTTANRLRLANIAARTRMILLFDQAKKHQALVIGTENYSEHLLGYFTRFGDEASDLEPIRHLYKTDVIELAKFLKVPQSIITKPPSADLWKGQTDATELGFTYEAADPILRLLNTGNSLETIVEKGFPKPLVEAVKKQVDSVAFKHQVPYLFSPQTK